MKIFSIAVNIHDHNTYDGVFHNQIERHNRRKHNIAVFFKIFLFHKPQTLQQKNRYYRIQSCANGRKDMGIKFKP